MISESTFDTYVTLTGQIILNNLLAGQTLQITRGVLSSQTTETPEELTVMNPESISTSQITLTNHGDYTNIEFAFDFSNLNEDLQFRSLGIYGKTANTNEKLIFVALVTENNQLVIPAHSPITYIISVRETFAVGRLEVYMSPDYATPISHHSDFTRHLFSQTNGSASLALVNSGGAESFANNDSIAFVPKVNVNNGAKIRINNHDYTLTYANINGGSPTGSAVFKAHRLYVLYFNNNSFVYREPEINIVNGSLTYWTGSEYKTVQDASNINSLIDSGFTSKINGLFRVQNGILHYYASNAWHSTMPAGMINAFANTSAPAGYILCNGWEYNKTTYPELFAVIGYTYGGSGDNFKVPNLAGKTIIGVNGSHTLSSTGGSEKHTLTVSEMPQHDHSVTITDIPYKRHKYGGGNNDSIANTQPFNAITNPEGLWCLVNSNSPAYAGVLTYNYADKLETKYTSGSGTTTKAGSNTAFDIMQPYMALNYYISTGKSLIS